MTKTEIALQVLQEGGYFRKALETDSYTHREQFHYRLRRADRSIVKGIGIKTYFALESHLTMRACPSSSTWPTEWVLLSEQAAA